VKAEGQKFGLPARQLKNRSHAFVEKVVPAPEKSALLEVHKQCDVFFAGAEIAKKDRNGAAAFA
jgi:hypothetical protein